MFFSLSLNTASSSWHLVFCPCSLSSAAMNSWFHRSSAINSSFCRKVAMRSSSISRLRSTRASVPGGIRRNIGGRGPSILGTHFLLTAKGIDSSSTSLFIIKKISWDIPTLKAGCKVFECAKEWRRLTRLVVGKTWMRLAQDQQKQRSSSEGMNFWP